MPYLLRAVGTPYEMSDILRTYGTLNTRYHIFYPYQIPNGIIFNDFTLFIVMSMNNAGYVANFGRLIPASLADSFN